MIGASLHPTKLAQGAHRALESSLKHGDDDIPVLHHRVCRLAETDDQRPGACFMMRFSPWQRLLLARAAKPRRAVHPL